MRNNYISKTHINKIATDLDKIWMEAVSQNAWEGLNKELDLEKLAEPTYGTFFATYGTSGNLWHFLARV